ncbi:Uncharacterized conserved protein YdaU, DUF1376 family [Nitrosomonas aestuarii]|uniref:Uncharacterized conserved protein YdaU, DUF1376 family n=1 Tax=Nitrosomonas aestuarii TaxID=52441 RepID=A0A1I4B5N3_9PROT|nr:YdaU family protein [Nitrosomonas aestuarii]SFK64064.1 Uncharacterized conserved protein YdaU, DUF1376 family [Nitrosomonas aestuarii]
MHHYQHNIGDYRRDTIHLSLLEHGVYRQLIDMYYLTESPIPSDIDTTCRKICARGQDEKEAVQVILNEFFELTDFGWIHSRCDAEIGKYADWDERNNSREENEKERHRRHREERKKIFSDLRMEGIHPKWNALIGDLRELHKLHCNSLNTRHERTCNESVTERERTCNEPVTERERTCNEPVTAITSNHKPVNHKPVNHKPKNNTVKTHTDCNLKPSHGKTPAGIVCSEIKKIGIFDVNPAHPKLLELIKIGATVDEFMHAARTAKDKKAGFAYVLGIVENQRQRAKAMTGTLHEGRLPNKQEALEKSNAAVASSWVPPEMRMRVND